MNRTPKMGQLLELFRSETKQLLDEPETPLRRVYKKNGTNHPRNKGKPVKGGIKVRLSSKAQIVEGDLEPPVNKKRERDKILPGYGDLQSLSRGIVKEEEVELELEDFVEAIKRFLLQADSVDKNTFYDSLEKIGLISSSRALEYANKKGYKNLEGWLQVQNSWERSKDGKLNEPSKK